MEKGSSSYKVFGFQLNQKMDSGIHRNDGMGEEKVLRFTFYVLRNT